MAKGEITMSSISKESVYQSFKVLFYVKKLLKTKVLKNCG